MNLFNLDNDNPWDYDLTKAPRSDAEEQTKILILDSQKRRFLAEWDPASGYYFMLVALDGLETVEFTQEFGRIYSPKAWKPLLTND